MTLKQSLQKTKNQYLITLAEVAGLIVAVFGFVALLGWFLQLPALATFGTGLIPMAPGTAILFVLLGISLFLYNLIPGSRYIRIIGMITGISSILTALVILCLFSLGFHSKIEQLGMSLHVSFNSTTIGHMSPVTAICFIIAALSFLLLITPKYLDIKKSFLAFWITILLVFISITIILAYIIGAPLMYTGTIIPPALPTSICFLVFGIGLLIKISLKIWQGNVFTDAFDSRFFIVYLLVFVFITFGIATTGYFFYNNFEKQYTKDIEQQLSTIADLKVNQLVQWRKERLGDANIFSGNPDFSNLVDGFMTSPDHKDARNKLENWLNKEKTVNNYDRVFLLDTMGNELMSVPADIETVEHHFIKDVKEVIKSKKVSFLDFHRDTNDNAIHLAVLAPVNDPIDTGKIIAIMVFRINPDIFLYPLINTWPTLSRSAETLILRREGDSVLFLNELRFRKNTALNLRFSLNEASLPAARAALGYVGIFLGLDYRGVNVISALRKIPDSPWFMVARMDLIEVYAPLRDRLWQMIALIVILILSIAVFMYAIWHRQSKLYFREKFEIERDKAWFQDVISRSLNEIFIFNADTLKYLFVNKGACQNIGYSEQELLLLTPLDIKPEFNEEKYLELLKPLKTGERELLIFETIHKRKDGSVYPVEVHLQLISTGNETVFLAITNDITERKQAEKSITVSETRYRRLFESARDGILILDAETGKIMDVNQFLIELLGYSREQFIEKAIWEIGFFKDIVANHDKFLELQQKEYIHYENLPLETANGLQIYVEFVSYVYSVSNHKVIQCNIRDITERLRAEELIKNNEKRFRELIETLPQLFWTCRVDGPCDYLSKQWIEYTGIPEAEQLGYRWLEQLHPEDRNRTVSEWAEKVKMGDGFDIEFRIRRNDGVYHWFKTRAVPMLDIERNIIKWFGSNTDIDDIKKATEQIKNNNETLELRVIERTAQLDASNKELEAFTYSVSHDLRAPLRHINGYVEMLTKTFPDSISEKAKHYLDTISDSAHQMGTLIDDLLQFSRTGRQELRQARMDMNIVFQEAFETIKQDMKGRNIKWAIAVLPHVLGDQALLRLVWLNLLSNAVKFTRTKKIARIEIGFYEEDKEYVFFVRDNGAGFDMQYANKLFGVFQRLHSSTEFEGTGIGLANVYRIISRHGGRIWAEAELDRGATFYFSLPKNKLS